MTTNPYESPREIGTTPNPIHNGDSPWVAIRKTVASGGVAFGGLWGLMGQFITFVPGAEAQYFGIAAMLVLFGILWPGWKVRAIAVVLFILFAGQAWDGHLKGIVYREQMRQREQVRQNGRIMGVEK